MILLKIIMIVIKVIMTVIKVLPSKGDNPSRGDNNYKHACIKDQCTQFHKTNTTGHESTNRPPT
jgi:hypothetical protein